MARSRLLILDDEPAVHQLVRTILKRGEYDLQSFLNPGQALQSARQSPPHLVITDVLMPLMDGWAFVKSLRATPAGALVPVIFLTSQNSTEDCIRGFRLGADDYLDKASEFWNLAERVARSLARGRELESAIAPSVPSGLLKGKFDQIGLASLLTVLDLGKRGGILRVRRPAPPEEGVIYIVDGRVHRADLQERKEMKDRDAVYAMLRWSDGTYEFTAEKLRLGDQVEMTTTELLLEGARRIDERRRA